MMAATMWLVKWCIIDQLLALANVVPALSSTSFYLLVLSTVLIAAGGYVVNDYLDTDIDDINKSGKNVVGKLISKKATWNIYMSLSLTGMAAAVLPAYEIGNVNYLLIQIISAGLLWFYSYSYKRQFLIGNIIVSVLSALVVLLPAYYEAVAENLLYGNISVNFYFVYAYTGFAFITTMAREVIKDLEDMKGDSAAGCKTFPIVAGVVPAKILVIVFSVLVVAAITYLQIDQFKQQDFISFSYFLVAVQLPSLWLIITVARAKEKEDYGLASKLSKLVMAGGILSMLVFKYTL